METFIAYVATADTVKYVLVFIFGGGLFTAIKTWIDHKEFKQNSKIADMKAPVELDNLKVAGLEVLTKNLQEDNRVLREDRQYWREQHEVLKEEVARLSTELDAQEARNKELRQYIEQLQSTMEKAEDNSPAMQNGREDLTE